MRPDADGPDGTGNAARHSRSPRVRLALAERRQHALARQSSRAASAAEDRERRLTHLRLMRRAASPYTVRRAPVLRSRVVVLALATLLLTPSAAFAHASLLRSDPPSGGVVG